MHTINGLKEIADRYKIFVLDLWGVLYDGENLFPHTLDTLEMLAKAKKQVHLITNNSYLSETNILKLEKLGLPRSYYQTLLSAGEQSLEMFNSHKLLPDYSRPLKAYIVEEEMKCDWAPRAKLERVNKLAEADLILGFHINPTQYDLSIYEPLIKEALLHRLPFVCTNPDAYVTKKGQEFVRVGKLAQLYEKNGGIVYYIGKPYADIYQPILQHNSPQDILIVGDSLTTDIKGAAEIGVESVLITSGNHQKEILGVSIEELPSYLNKYEVAPTYICPELKW